MTGYLIFHGRKHNFQVSFVCGNGRKEALRKFNIRQGTTQNFISNFHQLEDNVTAMVLNTPKDQRSDYVKTIALNYLNTK